MHKGAGCAITDVLLLDKGNKSGQYLTIQRSIEKAVLKEKYEWLTVRVQDNGQIVEEG